MNNIDLSRCLKLALKKRKYMRQSDLAKESGLTEPFLSNISNGIKTCITTDTLVRISTALQMTPSEFLAQGGS